MLLDWKKRSKMGLGRLGAAEPAQDTGSSAGEYRPLHKYLRDRFANRIVMTFAEVEDLLGFPLPEAARLQADWWGGGAAPAARQSAQADSWTLAGRTATVNLSASIVVFEHTPQGAH